MGKVKIMSENEYTIVDDFQANNSRVLILDKDYDDWKFDKAMIDGELFSYFPTSVRSFIVIKSHDSFKGKKVTFVNEESLAG